VPESGTGRSWRKESAFQTYKKERKQMRNRTILLIGAVVILALLATGGTVGAMALTHSGFMGNNGSGYGMMNGQSGYQGMMSSQYTPGTMMGGYQQTPGAQGTPVTGVTQVTIKNSAYQPANMQVRVGATVTWTNQDSVPHSVTFKQGMMKESGLLAQGQSFSYTFHTLGTYQYFCTVHPYMIATVTVVA
jgi:amicyanin